MISSLYRTTIRTRLILAFSFFSAIAVLTAALSWWGYSEIDQAQRDLLEQSLPLVEAAQDLSQRTTQLVLLTPVLQTAQTRKTFETVKGQALDHIGALTTAIERFDERYSDRFAQGDLIGTLREVSANTNRQVALVEDRLARADALQSTHAASVQAINRFIVQLKPIRASALSRLDQDLGAGGGTDPAAGTIERPERDAAASLRVLDNVSRLQSNALIVKNLLQGLLGLGSPEAVTRARAQYLVRVRRMARETVTLERRHWAAIGQGVDRLLSFAEGDGDMFSEEIELLELDRQLTEIGRLNDQLLQSIERQVTEIYADASEQANSDSVTAQQTAHTARLILLSFAALSVVAVFLVMYVMVYPRIIHKIQYLTSSVRSIAGGALETPVEARGEDEIAEMAHALDRFRRDLIVKQETEQRLRESEDRLKVTVRELSESNAELEQFAYVASHDLQEPLRKVAIYCDLLKTRYGDQIDGDGQEYIAFAVDGARRMQKLVSDLLGYSRIGRGELAMTEVDLNEVMAAVEADLGAVIEETSATIEFAGLPTVNADRSLLRSVLQNLVSNALKFKGDKAPVVRVAAQDDGANWTISVADNGIGIEPDYAQKIFELFQRLHGAAEYPGTGMGLAIAKRVIERHGGEIRLDTSYKEGARFSFTLPKAPEPDQ